MTQEERTALQRAGIMGVIVSILRTEEASLNQIKQRIVASFAMMIETEAVLHDRIDLEMANACKDYLFQEQALDEIKEMLK